MGCGPRCDCGTVTRWPSIEASVSSRKHAAALAGRGREWLQSCENRSDRTKTACDSGAGQEGRARSREWAEASAKLLGEFQTLPLVIRTDPRPVELPGPCGHALIDEPAHDLTMFQHEGRFVAADLQHATGACTAAADA